MSDEDALGLFAPDPRFRAGDEIGGEVTQFKQASLKLLSRRQRI